jgi:hypothetical protein
VLRLGIADHLGWAVAVTASESGEVIDRRRIALVEPGVTPAPIHYEAHATAALVAAVRASIARAASAALDDLPTGIVSMSLRQWPLDFPDDIEVQRRVPYESRADAIMYRQELSELAHARGWEVHLYDAKAVLDKAGDRVPSRAAMRAPWTKDHRVALAATIVAGGVTDRGRSAIHP